MLHQSMRPVRHRHPDGADRTPEVHFGALLPFLQKVELSFFLGVELFLLISGYVVTLALFKDEFRELRFLAKRAFRLFPVLLIFTAVSYSLVLAVPRIVPTEYPFFTYFAPADTSFVR